MSDLKINDFLQQVCANPTSETSQIAIALVMLVQALKDQPYFDKARFRASIEEALTHVDSKQPILEEILSALA
ncbi:hypothetical protein [Geomesophilobacter sediminis]|uniref:Uncharacterized protein n=1 Tax=Geomesophilobacter sediminis TaxID=2798584 RepID=A0A8J7M2J3_9BACT|nr:hypothetical protein [Geomesophilobacter sediminis]MBJ6727216.1 hypothetical protein [Geomesophilobacter sediminis]